MRRRPPFCAAALVVSAVLVAGALPAGAVNKNHGSRVVSVNPADHTPHVMDGAVLALTQVGDKVIAAGTFTSVSPAGTYWSTGDDLDRNGMFAFDADTGVIDPTFDPDLGAGGEARSLDTDGAHIYVAGRFWSVGGKPRYRRVAKLTTSGDPVPEFSAAPNGEVTEVVVRGSRLYLGGFFTRITTPAGTTTRKRLAALDKGTGAVLAGFDIPVTGLFDRTTVFGGGTTSIKRFDVSPDGSRLVLVGNFSRVGGQVRPQVAVLNTAAQPATVAPWSTDRYSRARNHCARSSNTFIRDVEFSPDGSWFVISTTAAFSGGAHTGTMCDTVTRWQTGSRGNNPRWIDYTGGDTTWGLAVTGGAVYVGGHMRWLNNPFQADQAGPGAVERPGIAALDPVNGLPLSWNPGRNRGVGAQALLATDQGLWVGSDTLKIGDEWHARVALMPLTGGTSLASVPASGLPDDLFVAKANKGGGVLKRRPARASGVPDGPWSVADASVTWSKVRGAFAIGGTMYHGWRDGRLYQRSFDPATGAVGPRSAVDLRDDPDDGTRIPFPVGRVTGMFFDASLHRIYYTLRGDQRLYYRYYTPESEIVGAQTFVAARKGVSFADARGMQLASGKVVYGSKSGTLRRVRFSGGRVTSRPKVLARGGWNARALLVPTG